MTAPVVFVSPTGHRYVVVNWSHTGMLRLRACNPRGVPVLYRTEADLAANGWRREP